MTDYQLDQGDLTLERWSLTLYVSGASPRSTQAIAALRMICDQDLAGNVDFTILNAADHPSRVVADQIVALPTLVKHSPAPMRQLVGNLSDLERVRTALDLPQVDHAQAIANPGGGIQR